MAFVKKTWVDRLSEFPGRRLLKKISGSADSEMVVDVVRSEGIVSRVGDPYSAANMNDLEQRIADEFDELNNDLVQQPKFIYDSTGKITSYKTPGGADTVFPFRNIENNSITFGGVNATRSIPLKALPQLIVVTCKPGTTTNIAGVWYDGVFASRNLIHSVSDSELIIISSWSTAYKYFYYLVY